MPAPASMLRRVLPTNSTGAALALDDGVFRDSVATANLRRVPLNGALAVLLAFFATTATPASTETFRVKIFAEYEVLDDDGSATGEFVRIALGTAACIVGTATGPTGGVAIPATDNLVDSITWTPTAALTALENAFNEGSSGVVTGVADKVALLALPCVGRASGLLLEFDTTDGDVSAMNAVLLAASV